MKLSLSTSMHRLVLMRVIAAIVISLLVSTAVFFTVKFWGQSQPYSAYEHPFFADPNIQLFVKPSFEKVDQILTTTTENVYLDIANTADQKVVIVSHAKIDHATDHTLDIRNKKYADVEKEVLLLEKYKDHLKNRKIIFNLAENAIAGHLIFTDELKKLGLDEGKNIIVTTPYEILARAIKEIKPTLLYGTTQPEILKIKAMESLHLIEAANIRADIVIYPLKYYNQTFYSETLLVEIKRRYKKFIVGPIPAHEIESAKKLNPFGIIVE